MTLVLFAAVSFVSASDISDNVTDQSTSEVANVQQNILGDGQETFDQLDKVINNDSIPEYGTVELDSDYTFSDSDISTVGTDGISIDKSITINGKGHTLNASNQVAIFKINNNARVILQNIIFTNGNASDGGAIYVDSGSSFEIINCTFSNNFASYNGGAIFLVTDSFTSQSVIINSTFKNNVALNGGAIYTGASSLAITLSNFSYNNASLNGGSLFIDGIANINQTTFDNDYAKAGGSIYMMGDSDSHSTIDFSTFKNSYSIGDGGACYINSNGVSVNNTKFLDNVAGDDGGALYWEGSNGIIYNITSTNNRGISISKDDNDTSSTRGGAICLTGSDVTISQSSFTNCYAYMDDGKDSSKVDGGAIFATGNDVIIRDVTFSGCNATNNGGALYVIGNETQIIDCTFEKSGAKDGAALYVNGINCKLYNSTFTNNIAKDDGGAIYWDGNDGVIYNITSTNNRGISYNASSTRGGAICLTGGNVTLSQSSFTNCYAYMDDGKDSSKVDGGAIFATGNDVIIRDVTFSGCNATNNGGALYVIGNNTQIIDCTFEKSGAKDGAALYVDGIDCKLYNSTFTNNIAKDDGGAIFWQGDNGLMYNITCTNNKGISYNDSSSRGGTICLTGNNVTVNKSTFTLSQAYIDTGKDISKVDGGALFITGNDVNIIDTVFTNCNATNRGGAMYILGNNSQVLNCNFTYTQAYIGGAIYVEGNVATIDNSLFRYNTGSDKGKTGGSGGAIYVDGNDATISNSDFAYGVTINYGGAISVWGVNTNITKNVFDNCTSKLYYGGAIFVNGANASISLSNFTRCKAENKFAQGGAIQVSGENAVVTECDFQDCFAYYGGDIYISGTNALVNNSNFNRSVTFKPTGTNKAQSPQWGAAIYVSGEYATILDSNFTLFTAEEYGGAICIQGANTVINGSNFDNCKAKSGGDIFVFGNNAIIEDSTFNKSSANYGGAIYLTAWGAVIKYSNITSCEASYSGGAIYVAGGGTTIIESNFEKCKASGTSSTYGGGAIYMAGSYNNIIDSNFNDNRVASANARGGTIYISSGEGTNIQGSYFNNSYAGNGGIIFMEGNRVIITTSTFANSSSRDYGGAISIQGHNATIQDSIFENFNSNHGGAIYVDGESSDILRSSFTNCVAKAEGGAISIADVGTTVAYSNFTLSHANTGGAININGENTTVTYCNLDNNTASVAGAIQISGENTLISNSNLFNNTASTAGAIKVTGANTLISDCNLTYNIAYGTGQGSGCGGAMDLSGQNASVRYSYFDHNDARWYGGAINWDGGHGDDSIIGSTFTFNNCNGSGLGGGAIYWTAGNGEIGSGGLIKDSVFINNTATGHHGGAIDWFHALDSVIDNCLFINNYASADGGALYTGDKNGNSLNFTISNSQFYNNTAGKHGGAIANQMTHCLIFNNTFDGNSATHSGGTILMKEAGSGSPGGTNSTIDHCYIYNTYCDVGDSWAQSGGAIQIGASDRNITISNCAIINSTCNRSYGGAISMASPDSSLINVTIQNVATNDGYGGAICWTGNNGYFNNVTIFNSSAHTTGTTRTANGGAIDLSGSNCILNDVTITTSSTIIDDSSVWRTNYGGSIFVSGTNNTLTNINIDDSQALSVRMNTRGGAIYWSGSSGTLINATISNTLANGQGGAIYWTGSSPTVENIFIEYSRTNVTNTSTNDAADGGAIYSSSINNLKNVYIVDSIASTNKGTIKGGAIYYNGVNMTNVTVIGSRASTDDGTSYGGAIYWLSSGTGYLYDSSFENNTADLGGAVFTDRTTTINGTTFTGNVALDGGALYGRSGADTIFNSTFELNSAKRGGAIYVEKVNFFIDNSTLMNNTAEEKGGAIYRNHNGVSYIRNSNLTNNTAFQGSAIYTVTFFELTNVTLLDNQANSKEFIEKAVGVDEDGNNYTSAIFVGYDNLLNAIWDEENTVSIKCNNVTYWGVNGINVTDSIPVKSDREVWINVTVEMFNGDGEKINESVVVTDANGRFKYIFDAEDGETYYFAYTHQPDRYYTYLRETMSNSSLVKVYVHDPIYYNQNQTILISLTDGAWGDITGNVTLEITGPYNTTFEIEVINGTWTRDNISALPLGDYNVSASFAGDINHTGDTDWVLFTVLPYVDLDITKVVNVTADVVNVSDVIKYTINVTNHGPSDATGVYVTENLSPYLRLIKNETDHGNYNLTNGTWYIADLAINETATLTIIAEVIHMGPITNTVWVYGDGNDTNLTNNEATAHNFTAVPITDLHVIKEINDTRSTINVLDEIKFTITVFNYGPSNATGVYVREALDSHLDLISYETSDGSIYHGDTWDIGTLANGANVTLTIIAKVIYSGNISNEVTVYGFENETNYTNNYDSIDNITAIANVDVNIIKTVNVTGYVNVTDLIEFNITVHNNGPCNASGVFVEEVLDSHLDLVSYNTTNNSTYDKYTWVIGRLDAGETVNLTIVARVISNGTIANAVVVKSIDNDTNTSNNNDTIDNITALSIVDLEIIKEVTKGGSFVNVTDEIEFRIIVTNHGPCDATNVTVSEVLNSHLTMTNSYTEYGYYNVREGVWYIGSLTNGSTAVLTIDCRVISKGVISNFVVVTSNENDTNMSNNNDTIDDIISADALDLNITKTSNITSGVVNVTDYIQYVITVHNNGPSNATGVNVTEDLGSYLRLVRNMTDYGYYDLTDGIWYIGNITAGATVNLTLVCEVIGNGTIDNVVVVTSNENDTNPYNNRDELIIVSNPIVDLRIVKTVNVNTTEIDVNVPIQFNVTVFNDGPCNATGVYVQEPLSPRLSMINYTTSDGSTYDGYTWVIGDLASGTNVTLVITALVAYSGEIENFVIVFGNEIDTNESNNYDNITNITAFAHVDVGVNKTVNITTGVVNVSDLIEFNITVYNNGPCNASGVIVVESLDTHLELVSYNTTNNSTYDGYSWNVGNVNVGEPINLTIVARVVSEGIFGNFVSVVTYDNDTNPDNDNDTIDNITALPVVDLEIIKEVTFGGSVVNVSDVVQFSITVINNGPCDATNVTVSEVLSPHLEMTYNSTWVGYYDVNEGIWHIGTLEKNTNVTLIIQAKVISDGIISNFVSVNSTENDTNTSNNNDTIDNITALPVVDLEITKTSNITSGVVNVTDYIEYTITVHNNGPSNATGVNVTEDLGSYLRLVKNETEYGYYDVNEGVWYIGDLNNGSSVNLTLVCEVIGQATIDNVVVVTSYENDTNPYNNRDELIIVSNSFVDLRIVKTVNITENEIDVNDVIQFNVTVFNDGPCNATGVFVLEPLDSILEMINYTTSDGSTYDGYTWVIGNVGNGDSVTLLIVAKVAYSGAVENFVTVFGNEKDTNESNNKANVTNITARTNVDMGIIKTVNVTVVNVTDYIEFTITVYNNGSSDATGVVVTEALDSHINMISYNTTDNSTYDGYSWMIGNVNAGESVNLTIIAQVISQGIFSNFVSVICFENDTNPDNDNYTIDNITALPIVDLEITKTVNVDDGIVYVGDIVVFTITVKNNGPCDASGVNVTEVLSPHLRLISNNTWLGYYDVNDGMWYIGDLSSHDWVVLIIEAQVISRGIIENVVVVTSNENDTNPDNNNDSIDNITAMDSVDLEIAKTVDVTDNTVYIGEVIEFTIRVQNNGICNATGVNVSEVLSPHIRMIANYTSKGYYSLNDAMWYVGDLTVEEEALLVIQAQVISEGIIENVVVATSNENDTDPDDNNASIDNITAIKMVDVSVNKTVSVTQAYVGDTITYVITVHNSGPNDATNVNVTEKLSNYVSLIEATASTGRYDPTDSIWYIGKLNNGSTQTLTLKVQLISEGIVENIVSINSTENDTNTTNNNYTCDNVTVNRLNTPIDLNTYNITYGEDEILVVTLPSDASGTVNITVSGVTYDDVPLDKGVATLPVVNLGGGDYTVDVDYGGDNKYLPNSTSGKFTVLPVVPIIKIEVVDIWVGEVEVLNVTVNAPGTVNITVYGRTIEVPLNESVTTTDVLKAFSTEYDGKATWNLVNLPAGKYPAFAIYNGNENYTSVNTSDTFIVKKLPSTVSASAEDIYVGEDAVVKVKVGPSDATGNVTITVDGKKYTSEVKDGEAEFVISGLKAGTKQVSVSYSGDDKYLSSKNTTTFKVKKYHPPIDSTTQDIIYGKDETIVVELPDDATGKVTIIVDGKKYTAKVKDGKATFVIPGLTSGKYDVQVYYSGDGKYYSAKTTNSFKVTQKANPHNDTNITHKTHAGLDLTKHPTGNPIFVLLMVLISSGVVIRRGFKK